MPCRCIDCSETPALTYTEKYRHESEVREVMRRFGTKELIKEYLAGIEKARGTEAMQRLRKDLLIEWELLGRVK